MQTPTDQAEASFPTETTVINNDNVPNMNHTVKERRKSAKRTLHFGLTTEELNLVSPPHHEDIPARKKPRLEEPLPTRTDEAARKTASPDVLVGLSPSIAEKDDANANANADPVTDTQPNDGATRATGSWTLCNNRILF
jgi:hypothetical protein